MTCKLCRRVQDDGFEKIKCDGIETVPECPAGKVPKLLPGNRHFWFLFTRMLPGLNDAYGGFRFDAIRTVLDFYEIPRGQRPVIHDKCLVVISAINEIREANKTVNLTPQT